MMDWFLLQIWEVVKIVAFGFLSFVLSMWFFNKYILPRMVSNMGSSFLKQAMEDSTFKPWIARFQKIIEELEPVVAKVKKVDFEKIAEDAKPFMEALKKINPEDIDALLKALRELTGTVRKAIEKPDIPEPG